AVVERDVGATPGTPVEAAAVGSTVRVRFQVDEEVLEAPIVRLTWPDTDDGFSRQAAASPTSTGYEMVTTIAATDPIGAVSVSVIAIDLASNVGNAELPRHFLVDTSSFLLSSVSLRPRSPVPTELTAIGVDVTVARNELPGIAEIEAQLIFSKPPRQTPEVTLEGPGGSIVGTVSALATTSFSVTFEIDDDLATAASGDVFELFITAHDAAGLPWELEPTNNLPTVVIDTEPPVMPASLRFLRAPWGAGSALPERSFAVESTTAGAVVGSASSGSPDRLFVHDAEGVGRARLGFASLSASGVLPGDRLALATVDRLEVFATLIDDAGNEGPTLRVADGRWVATFKDRTTGNDFLNPNRLTRVSEPSSALADGLATEAATADISRVFLADGQRFTHSVRSGVWRFRRLGSPPSQAAGGGVYVPSSDKVLLVGGSSDDSIFPNMWDWDGRDWRELDLIGTLWPGENFGPALTHDSARDRTIYHGGTATAVPLTRTWEYDGTTWFDVTPTTPGPPSVFAPMVYDAGAGVSVLYGALEEPVAGVCPAGGLPQALVDLCVSTTTWLWDGSSWEAVPCPGGVCPPPRAFTSMAYDPESRRVVLFGGSTSFGGGANLGDLWEWDTLTRTWDDVTPVSGLTASARRSAIMSYVGGFGGVVIWGGCETGEFFDCARDADMSDNMEDILVWKGSAATPSFGEVDAGIPSGLSTPLVSRGVGQAAYLPARDRMLVFGGVRQLNVAPVVDCSPLFDGACDGEDPDTKTAQGGGERCTCAFDSGWMLRPTSATTGAWTQVAAESAVHSPTTAFSMTYSAEHRRAFIFGGRLDNDGDCEGAADN
ncbi:MAG TPA: kelch repeat-containing protein, partial [Myxococcota bacterium]|nr:kelch repeat-containing protein [Myxococcota bacterium]